MSFQISLLLTADGQVATAEVRKLGDEAKKTTTATEKLGAAGAAAKTKVSGLGKAADQADNKIVSLAAAEREAERRARALAKEKNKAAMATGNLVAQGNDLIVMMMAGQNPLQMAVQQGTQITQVIGPMGAAGAYKALGNAALSMINPLNMITLASIATGAAVVGWLTDAGEEALTLEELLQQTRDTLKGFGEDAELAGLGAADMVEKFGTADPVLKSILADMAALKKVDLYRSLDAQAQGVRDLVLDLSFWDDRSAQSAAQDFLGLSSIKASARQAGDEFARNLEILSASEEPAVKLKAAMDLRQQLINTAGGLEQLNAQQREFYNGLSATIRDLILIGAKVDQVEKAANENAKALIGLWQDLKSSASDYVQERMKEDGAARGNLASLREQVAIQQAINRYGEGSVRVIELRQQAERRVFEEKLATMNVAEELKQEMRETFEAKQKLAHVNLVSGMSSAANEARRIADELTRALGASMALSSQGVTSLRESEIRLEHARDPVATAGALARERMRSAQGVRRTGAGNSAELAALDEEVEAYAQNMEQIERNNQARLKLLRTTKSGARSANRERDAIKRLIAKQQEQLDLLRETDPVQQEMIRNRQALTSATDAERTAVEQIISKRIAEQAAMEGLQERQDFFNQSLHDGLDGLIFQGESLEDVLNNVGRALAQAALQAAILGEGPLAKLFGWTTPLISFSSGGLPALAEGGDIQAPIGGGKLYGPGGGTDDKVLMWGSSGEFMMNARATAQYRHLLEAMNAGAVIPALASGGAIGAASSPVSGAGLVGSAHLRVSLEDGLMAELLETSALQSVEIVGAQLESYDRALPRRMRAINEDPGRIG